jgi:hypothetical protein
MGGFSLYRACQVLQNQKLHLPYKKPRKSKTDPTFKRTDIQNQANKSQVSVALKHAIAGMKRYRIFSM